MSDIQREKERAQDGVENKYQLKVVTKRKVPLLQKKSFNYFYYLDPTKFSICDKTFPYITTSNRILFPLLFLKDNTSRENCNFFHCFLIFHLYNINRSLIHKKMLLMKNYLIFNYFASS